jgi:hypothetical protein
MATLYSYPFSAWISYYNQFAESALERFQEIGEELENRTYKPEQLLSDVLGFWWQGATSWWDVMQQTAGGPVPIVFIKMRPDEESASTDFPAPRRGSGQPTMTPLGKISEPSRAPARGAKTKKPDVEVQWLDKRSCVAVTVHGLDGTILEPGLYQASVHYDEKLLAIVQVLVE